MFGRAAIRLGIGPHSSFSLALTVEALQGKTGGIGQFGPRFQGKGSSLGNIFGFYKTRHILLSGSAKCTVLRAVVLTQYFGPTCDRRTDRKTDGNAIARTALAMRALRRAVTRNNFSG